MNHDLTDISVDRWSIWTLVFIFGTVVTYDLNASRYCLSKSRQWFSQTKVTIVSKMNPWLKLLIDLKYYISRLKFEPNNNILSVHTFIKYILKKRCKSCDDRINGLVD
ncbi:unnamed protein product, partial [Owenia fusiformis]